MSLMKIVHIKKSSIENSKTAHENIRKIRITKFEKLNIS